MPLVAAADSLLGGRSISTQLPNWVAVWVERTRQVCHADSQVLCCWPIHAARIGVAAIAAFLAGKPIRVLHPSSVVPRRAIADRSPAFGRENDMAPATRGTSARASP